MVIFVSFQLNLINLINSAKKPLDTISPGPHNNRHGLMIPNRNSDPLPRIQYCMINPYDIKSHSNNSPLKLAKERPILKGILSVSLFMISKLLFVLDLDLDLFSADFIDMATKIEDYDSKNFTRDLIYEIWNKKDNLSSFNKRKHFSDSMEAIYSIKIENDVPKRLLENIIENHKNDKIALQIKNIYVEDHIMYLTRMLLRLKETSGMIGFNNNNNNNTSRIDQKDLNDIKNKINIFYNIHEYSETMKKNLHLTKLFLENNIKSIIEYSNNEFIEDNSKVSLDFITVNKLLDKLTCISAQELNKTSNDNQPKTPTINVRGTFISPNTRPISKSTTSTQSNKSIYNDSIQTVIYTYDLFINSITLLMLLIIRYNVPKPFNMTREEVKYYENNVTKLIKLKIMSIIKFWVSERQEDFLMNSSLYDLLMEFLHMIVKSENDIHTKQISKYLLSQCQKIKSTKKKKFTDSLPSIMLSTSSPSNHVYDSINETSFSESISSDEKLEKTRTQSCLSPVHARNNRASINFNNNSCLNSLFKRTSSMPISLHIDDQLTIEEQLLLSNHVEVAQQLVLLEYKLFSKITICELVNIKFDNDGSVNNINHKDYCSSYKKFINRTNNTMNWVEYMILKQSDINRRNEFIKKFLMVAQFCLTIQDYNTCHTIVAAICSLKQYIKWRQDIDIQLNELKECFGIKEKLSYYTTRFKNIKGPCIPLMWVYSSLLQRYQEGKCYKTVKNYNNKKYIHFALIIKIADLCSDLKRLQMKKYNIEKKADIYTYIKKDYNNNGQLDLENEVKKMKDMIIVERLKKFA